MVLFADFELPKPRTKKPQPPPLPPQPKHVKELKAKVLNDAQKVLLARHVSSGLRGFDNMSPMTASLLKSNLTKLFDFPYMIPQAEKFMRSFRVQAPLHRWFYSISENKVYAIFKELKNENSFIVEHLGSVHRALGYEVNRPEYKKGDSNYV